MDFNALLHTGNPPFHASVSENATAPSSGAGGSPFAVTGGFPTTTSSSASYTAWSNLKPQRVLQYSLVSEYQISNTASVLVQYVGEDGNRLLDERNPNQWTRVNVPTSAPYYSTVGSNAITLLESEGVMNFNAGEISYRQRPRQGLEFTLNYTYAHNLTDAQGTIGVNDVSGPSALPQDSRNLMGDYGPAEMDVRNMLNATWVYELPFGTGKRFAGNANRFADELIGGWRISGDAVLYSGFPITITANGTSQINGGTLRAMRYRRMKITGRQTKGFVSENEAGWWGTDPSALDSAYGCAPGKDDGVCAYGQPLVTTGSVPNFAGTAGVGTERSPGFRGIDAALLKTFPIVEGQKLEFTANAYNVGNISSYNSPGRGVDGGSTWGLIQSTRSQQRQLELALRYRF
jgi:hypothetical protein